MFRKSRTQKLKVVFQLQFQATKISNPGSKLILSLIPEDVGRPTVRLGKVVVGDDGNCTWLDPVYETVKLLRETKTGKFQDKFYHFIVATGTSKKGFVGEILFNFADFVEAGSPVTVWQPISGSNPDAALHVTIQNMQGGEEPREVEENGETRDRCLRSQLSNSTTDDRNSDRISIEDDYWNTILSQDDEQSRTNYNEQASFKSLSDQRSVQDPRKDSSSNSVQEMRMYLESSSSEPSPTWNSLSQRKTSSIAAEDMSSIPRSSDDKVTRKRQTLSNASPEQLKKEIISLERQAEVMELEIQTLRRQVVKETKRGQELSRQASSLKEEKESLRIECEKSSFRKNEMGHGVEVPLVRETDSEDSKDRIRVVEDELSHVKSVNKMLRRQLGKTQDSNSELILVVKDLEDRLDKKVDELAQVSAQHRKSRKSEELQFQNTSSQYKHAAEENKVGPKDLFPNGSSAEVVKSLKEKIVDLEEDLQNQIEEKERLQEKMSQVLQDYEISKQKNIDVSTKFEDARRQVIEKENQCMCYLRAIEELESEITKMEKVMEMQAEDFSESSEAAHKFETQIKVLENELQNKTQENEDLRKAKINDVAASQRVQEEFQKLSTELTSKFNENEKLTMQSQTEANELHLQVKTLKEQLGTANEDVRLLKEDYDMEVEKLSEELTEKDKQLEQLLVKLQEECKVLESAKQKHEGKSNTLSKENSSLRVEMERLTEENYHLSKQSKDMNTSVEETKRLAETRKKEKEDLEKKHSSLRIEAQDLEEELNNLRSSSEKKSSMIEIFQQQLQQLRAQHDTMQNHLCEEKTQNANLKEKLQKKDQEISQMEEKYKNRKDNNGSSEKTKQATKSVRKAQPESIPLQNGAVKGSLKSRKDQKGPDARSDNEGELTKLLLSQVEELKEKNRSTESELKEIQDKYSDVSLRFAEVEGERQQLVMTVRNLRNGQKK